MKKINTEGFGKKLVRSLSIVDSVLIHFGTCLMLFALLFVFFASMLKEITLTDVFQLIIISTYWIIVLIYYYANKK